MAGPAVPVDRRPVRVPVGGVVLDADLAVPKGSRRLVLFAHGSASSRHSPRNRFVAGVLNDAGLATMLADLLTVEEERVDVRTAELRFDVGLLGERVATLSDWAVTEAFAAAGSVGVFGASTGAAAALVAASNRPGTIAAVVSRGGRPDLAGAALPLVRQPTLLVVGGADDVVLALNREALRLLAGEARLEVVPGATHLFEEAGALERVAVLARDWFVGHLADPSAAEVAR